MYTLIYYIYIFFFTIYIFYHVFSFFFFLFSIMNIDAKSNEKTSYVFVVPFPKNPNFSFHPYFLHHNIFSYLDSIVRYCSKFPPSRFIYIKRSKRGEFAAIRSQNSQTILVQSTTSSNIKIKKKGIEFDHSKRRS